MGRWLTGQDRNVQREEGRFQEGAKPCAWAGVLEVEEPRIHAALHPEVTKRIGPHGEREQ